MNASLRWKGFGIKIQRIANVLYVEGLDILLVISPILWMIPLFLACYVVRSMILGATVNACQVTYFFIYRKVISPSLVRWSFCRSRHAKDMFIKKVTHVLVDCHERKREMKICKLLECPELGLNPGEISMMKQRLVSIEAFNEA